MEVRKSDFEYAELVFDLMHDVASMYYKGLNMVAVEVAINDRLDINELTDAEITKLLNILNGKKIDLLDGEIDYWSNTDAFNLGRAIEAILGNLQAERVSRVLKGAK